MSNLFIVSVLLENPVFRYFVYTMLYITEVHSFFGTILYIAIVD